MNSYTATGQLLGRALAELGRTEPKPVEPSRKWLSKCLTFEAAGDVLVDYLATGEITKADDPDIHKGPDGLWWLTIEEAGK